MTGLAGRYAALTALRWLPVGLMFPVLVLLIQARGLDLAATGRLLALYSAVTLLLELPTGGLADVVGRRSVLIAASLSSAIGAAFMAVGTSLSPLIVAVVLSAIGRALGSGPLEAWYVDAIRRDDAQADIRHGLAAGQTAEAAALGVGALIGGAIPAWAAASGRDTSPLSAIGLTTVIPLSVPFAIAAVLFIAHALAVLLLVHQPQTPARADRPSVSSSILSTVSDGMRASVGHAGVRRLLLYSAVFGFALSGIELISPGHVATVLGSVEAGSAAYGVLVAVSFGANAFGAWLTPRIVRPGRSDPRPWAIGFSVSSAIAVCIVGAPLIGGVAAGLTLTYMLIGMTGPLVAEMLHDRISESTRSTMLSMQSLTLQAGGLVASLTLGAIADRLGIWPAYLILGVVLGSGSFLLPGTAHPHSAPRPDS